MDDNRTRLRRLNAEIVAEREHDALLRVRLYRRLRRLTYRGLHFGRETFSRYWWMIGGLWVFYFIVAIGGDTVPLVGPLGAVLLAGLFTHYDLRNERAELLVIVLRERIQALKESGLDLEATIAMLIGDQVSGGERPGVWVGQTWYEIEEDDS